jgi:acyl carrier protein
MSTEHKIPATRDAALEIVIGELVSELNLTDYIPAADDDLDILPGADSVRLMRVVAVLERRFGMEFDDAEIRRTRTVGEMADLLLAGVQVP